VGRSLGTGVAVRLASQKPVTRLVLVTPYNSLLELATEQFAWFPVRWLLTDKFQSWRYAAQVRAPTLLIAAENDEVIPGSSTARLHAQFQPGIASLSIVPSTAHNTISLSPRYRELLRFLDGPR
jgi:hypothetical protein